MKTDKKKKCGCHGRCAFVVLNEKKYKCEQKPKKEND